MLQSAVVDVSAYQIPTILMLPAPRPPRLAWMQKALASAKAGGLKLVIVKATEGQNVTDEGLVDWVTAAKAVSLPVAVYHFLHTGDPEAQADHFAQAVAGLDLASIPSDLGDVPRYWVDWENAKPPATADETARFVARVIQRLGERPGVYTGNVGKEALKGVKHPILALSPLWLAQYATKAELPWPTWQDAWLWQYTDQGQKQVAGFSDVTGLDVSHFFGSRLGGWSTTVKVLLASLGAVAGFAVAGPVGAVAGAAAGGLAAPRLLGR